MGWEMGSGGKGLTSTQASTLKHFKYSSDSNQLEATRAIQTTLNSFFLGGIHSMSSGFENIFFKNHASDVNWYSAWGGIKEQSISANQDATGVVAPSMRTYTDSLVTVEANGSADVGGVVNYSSANVLSFNASVHGIEFIVEEAVSPDDFLSYEIKAGVDDTGLPVFDQLRTGLTLAAGDRVIWWFDHPIEGHDEQQIFTELMIRRGSQDAVGELISVRRSATQPSKHYVMSKFREFKDERIALSKDFQFKSIDSSTTGADLVIKSGDKLNVNASGGAVNFTVDLIDGWHCEILDYQDTFGSNDVSVIIGVDTLVFDSNSKERSNILIRDGNTIRAYDGEGQFSFNGDIT